MSDVDLLQLYANRMGEMKKRMVLIDAILKNSPRLGDDKTSNEDGPALEYFALQFRKVLELIAFGGLIANKAIYEEVHKDFVEHAYPSKISKRLDGLHAKWFSEHVNIFAHASGHPNMGQFQRAASAFTRERWQLLYDKMGLLLHVGNPFAGPVQIELNRPLPETYSMVRRHMQSHLVTVLQGPHLICNLGAWPDGHCNVNAVNPIEGF